MNPSNIIISTRANKIGDVILSLPLAALLKQRFPGIVVAFIGTYYTRIIIEACAHVDVFIDEQDFLQQPVRLNGLPPECIVHSIALPHIARRAKQLHIPLRIGTSRRFYHWLTCNRFVWLNRKNSPLHEAQLNIQMLKPFAITTALSLPDIADLFGLSESSFLPPPGLFVDATKFKLIIHAKSGGSAHEWPLQHYIALINDLDAGRFQIFISGTEDERTALQPLLDEVGDKVTDVIGSLNLPAFMGLIAASDGLVACSTGPLHIAAALGKHAFGIYAPARPIFPQRWGPIGKKAQVFVLEKKCNACKNPGTPCFCIQSIQPNAIKNALDLSYSQKFNV